MSIRHRTATTAGLVLALTGVAACGDDDQPAARTADATPPATSTATGATDAANVKRGAAVTERGIDVQVGVGWKGGTPNPASSTVRVAKGDHVQVLVTADSHQDVTVSGHPDAAADVDPDEAEDIDFTVDSSTTTVRIGDAALATFVTD